MSKFLIGVKSDAGRQRSNNEDSYIVTPPKALTLPAVVERGLLAAVADGVGGRQAGEVASQTAVRHLYEAYYRLPFRGATPTLVEAVNEANRAVWAAAQQSRQEGMATTLAAVIVRENAASLAYVGDSRIYLISPASIRLLTSDHTVVNELLSSGALTQGEAANHPQRHILSRSLGSAETVDVSGSEVVFGVEDVLLLCSDGLSNQVAERTMAEAVRTLAPQAAAERLVALANAAGGGDNITVIIVRPAAHASAAASPILAVTQSAAASPTNRRLLFGIALVSLFVIFLIGLIGRSLGQNAATPTPTRTRTPVAAATLALTQVAIAPTAAPFTATLAAPTSTVAAIPVSGRKATLRDPWGTSGRTFLFSGKNDQTGGPTIPLDGSAEIIVYGMEVGAPTDYRPSGSDSESRMWYRAEYNGQRGWVVCPLVWFTDERQWATCEQGP